ncbi:Retinoic acid induced 16-like protein-domain-containing protein [Auriculariales sp. MPI-PUGE-AT-0066]|nr:Retinoic acid induced 16-like protein-domain-containing protein [Auriculariales sp. MPI-PUGE-AT-0066]
MDYFAQFLRATSAQISPKTPRDLPGDLHIAWTIIQETLEYPDERQLRLGITSTNIPAQLKIMVDTLVSESTSVDEGTIGPCLEYLLKNDVLSTLVHLSEADRPAGVQAQVLKTIASMIVSLDEHFLVHTGVHNAVIRLLRSCAGDELQERIDGRARNRAMGAAGSAVKTAPSEYEEDLVDLLCIICGRIRTYRDLLMIFFMTRTEEEEEEEDEDDNSSSANADTSTSSTTAVDSTRSSSPTGSQRTVTSAGNTTTTQPKPEYEFLIFNYMLRFVHREGKIGEFARAGLLFLIDIAFTAGSTAEKVADPVAEAELALAEYVLEGDFADVLGAGLGAVYSVLPSKLSVQPDTKLQFSDNMQIGSAGLAGEVTRRTEQEHQDMMGVERSTTTYFRQQLDHFLKLLSFLQEVLRRNEANEHADQLRPGVLVGNAITNSILDAVRRVFLESILYTSVLECSDVDGSAVAVMSYIEIMVRSLRQNSHLSELLVQFLMSEDDSDYARPRAQKRMLNLSEAPSDAATTRARKLGRRKSSAMLLLEQQGASANRQSMYVTAVERFTLKDLILTNIRSSNKPTATAAYQLLQTLLAVQCHATAERLFLVMRDPAATMFPEPARILAAEPPRSHTPDSDLFVYPGAASEDQNLFFDSVFAQPTTTIATHEREMALYMNLVAQIDAGLPSSEKDDPFSTSYEHYLHDAIIGLQSHSCSSDGHAEESWKHRLDPNGPLMSAVLHSLRSFFSNAAEQNITLTGVLSQLALCPTRGLSGWLTFGSAHPDLAGPRSASPIPLDPHSSADGDDRSVLDAEIDNRLASSVGVILPLPDMGAASHPVIHALFQGLVAQLGTYRSIVPQFDRYLAERRQGLLFSENLTDALNLELDIDPVDRRLSISSPPTRPKPMPTQSQPKPKSGFASLFTPRKTKKATEESVSRPSIDEPSTTPHRSTREMSVSPFAPHYKQTGSVSVEALSAPVPTSGPWMPNRRAVSSSFGDDGGHSAWNDEPSSLSAEPDQDEEESTVKVTLSQLLDNVVILEESIKELTAIIHARRTLGIDGVRFV